MSASPNNEFRQDHSLARKFVVYALCMASFLAFETWFSLYSSDVFSAKIAVSRKHTDKVSLLENVVGSFEYYLSGCEALFDQFSLEIYGATKVRSQLLAEQITTMATEQDAYTSQLTALQNNLKLYVLELYALKHDSVNSLKNRQEETAILKILFKEQVIEFREMLNQAIIQEAQLEEVTYQYASEFKNKILYLNIVMDSLLILILAIYSRQLYRSVMNPINALKLGAAKIRSGEFDIAKVKVDIYRRDEIGALSHTFNDMATDLGSAVRNKERMVIAETKAQAEEQKARELLILNNEITEADHKLKASLAEKEVLLKEIHHRVKNNMQVITSLMALQARQVTDKRLLYEFQSTQHRIQSMAMIHEMLYGTQDLVHINYEHYLNSLVPRLITSMKGIDSNIATDISATDIQLGIDTAIPLGLLINELVTNSLKYAFPNGAAGNLSIVINHVEPHYTMCVSDDGVGFPEDHDFEQATSLGLRLVMNLVTQLEGTLVRGNAKGTRYDITFNQIDSST